MTVCPALFLQLCTTTRGDHALCCEAQQQINPTQDWREWWHSPELDQRRRQLLAGEWPAECQGCARAEQSGRGSLRESYVRNYPQHQVQAAVEQWQHTGRAPDPVSVDLAVGNTCNLQCRQCNAEWSSAIAAQQGVQVARPQASEEWYEQLPPEPLHTVKVQGGEPLLQPRLWRWLASMRQPAHTRFEMVTNGTRDPRPYRDIMMRFRERVIFVSVDGIGDRAAELRRGTDWNQVQQTVQEFQSWSNTYTAAICCVYRDNIQDTVAVQQWANQQGIDVIWNILNQPEHLTLAHVSQSVRDSLDKTQLPKQVKLALDSTPES